jgi:hypothetical protein
MPVSSLHVTAKSVIIIIESKLDNYNSVFLQYRSKKMLKQENGRRKPR